MDKRISLLIIPAILIIAILIIIMYNPSSQNNMMNQHMAHMMVTSEEQFIAEMIPHHQEAVDTATIVLERTVNPKLRVLAQNIVTTQTKEIEMMKDWQTEWYQDSNYEPLYMNMMPNLERLYNNDLDLQFLQGMIMHHMMAIHMANQVLRISDRPEIIDFANDIIEVQSDEINQMRDMLKDY